MGLASEAFIQSVQVAFKTSVYFTKHVFDPANPVLAGVVRSGIALPAKLLVVLEAGLIEHHPDLCERVIAYARCHDLQLVEAPLLLEGGEVIKQSFASVERVLAAINRCDIDRHSYVLAVGGGALLDAVGFAAAIAHRGVRLIRAPTTVLSQNDSGVGVKNAINYFGKKNWLGSFAPPHAVLNDSDFLESLPEREWRAGMAEAVKIALIRDAEFFELLEKDALQLVARSMPAMRRLIQRCALGHMAHIREGGDPFEMGSARPLDHGHWSAHKLEALSGWDIRHGEAVAIGLALDAIYARRMGFLAVADCGRILALLTTLGFELWAPQLEARDNAGRLQLIVGLEEFRQHLGGALTITLIEAIGHGFEVHEIDAEVIAASLAELKGGQLQAAA
jgi:3-dehydroquinate synthase